MAQLGHNLIVSLDGTALAGAKSCTFTCEADVNEISSPSQGQYKQYYVSRKSWKVSTSHLVTGVKADILRVGQTYTLKFGLRDSATDYLTGNAICRTCRIDGTDGSLAKGSFEFIGNGALTGPPSS